MKKLLFHRPLYVYIVIGIIAAVGYMVLSLSQGDPVELVTTTVERGTVERLVSVSGIVEAEQTAQLAFPASGIVSAVNVSPGDIVQAGDVLVTLETRILNADRADALAARARAVATRDELAAGADSNTRLTSAETVTLRETSLSTTQNTQAELIANARRTLLSSDLTAISSDPDEEAVAPIITGTYACDTEGT
jgi:multidrug efflux pump subunit AcrA (membrane-fusion protein)